MTIPQIERVFNHVKRHEFHNEFEDLFGYEVDFTPWGFFEYVAECSDKSRSELYEAMYGEVLEDEDEETVFDSSDEMAMVGEYIDSNPKLVLGYFKANPDTEARWKLIWELIKALDKLEEWQ